MSRDCWDWRSRTLREIEFFYVNYTETGGDTVIAEKFTAAGDVADPNSELRLLGVQQPFPNHNGGGLAFSSRMVISTLRWETEAQAVTRRAMGRTWAPCLASSCASM